MSDDPRRPRRPRWPQPPPWHEPNDLAMMMLLLVDVAQRVYRVLFGETKWRPLGHEIVCCQRRVACGVVAIHWHEGGDAEVMRVAWHTLGTRRPRLRGVSIWWRGRIVWWMSGAAVM